MTFILDESALSEFAFGMADAASAESIPPDLTSTPLVPAPLASIAHLMPRLIDIRTASDKQRLALLECLSAATDSEEAPPVTLLAKTEVSRNDFIARWNSLQLATIQPKRKVWMRLHDPRVLHQLLRILNQRQRRKLFGGAKEFAYWVGEAWTTAGVQVDVEPRAKSPESGAASALTEPTKWDWPRIEQIGVVNRALQGAGIRRAADLVFQGAVAERCIERAKTEHGLNDHADLVEFAIRGLTVREQFDKHPAVAHGIRPGIDPGESTLADRLALIDKSVWDELRQNV